MLLNCLVLILQLFTKCLLWARLCHAGGNGSDPSSVLWLTFPLSMQGGGEGGINKDRRQQSLRDKCRGREGRKASLKNGNQ